MVEIPASKRGVSHPFLKLFGGELLTLKEESCLVGNQVTSKVLRRVHQAGDNCSPQIGTLNKVEEGRGTALLHFDLNGSLHHGKCLVGMLCGFTTEALDGAKGLLFASVTDKPPRRFGGEEDEDQEGGLDESALVTRRHLYKI